MTRRTTRTIAVIAALALALSGIAYWYWSPLIALQQMQAAAKAHDAPSFNDHVDYAKLREDLKRQLGARLADAIGTQGSDAQRAGTSLGTALGTALVDRMVDGLVQPDTVMQAMRADQAVDWLEQLPGVKAAKPAKPAKSADAADSTQRRAIDWRLDREGADRVVAYAVAPKAADAAASAGQSPPSGIGLVFERSGLAGWKLSGVRLPPPH